jgi:hypothetical protein
MAWCPGQAQASDMDTLSLLIIAIGSLAFLDLAAANLRGPERPSRLASSSRSRR